MENVALVTIKVPYSRPSAVPYSSSSARPASSSSNSSSKSTSSTAKMLLLPPVVLPTMPDIKSTNLTRSDLNPPHDGCSLGVKFISAGMAACIADLATFPLDTAKVRLQIQGSESMAARLASTASTVATSGGRMVGAAGSPPHGLLSTMLSISRSEGVRALYSGLSPGLQRQMCFASVRIGLYDAVKATYSNILNVEPNQKNIGLRILAGITTGGAAVLVAQPTDVVKVRMQAQGKKTGGNAVRYSGSLNAYRIIATQEGVRGLWKGTVPNVSRNAIVNCTELVSYDLIKEALLSHQVLRDGIPCHFLSAVGAGFFTTLLASPVDVLKTRFMNSQPGVYNGVVHCAQTMYQEGGLRTFYKGCVPAFLRFGPWNVVMFISYEQLKKHLSSSSISNSNSIYENTNNNSSSIPLTKISSFDVKSVSSRFI